MKKLPKQILNSQNQSHHNDTHEKFCNLDSRISQIGPKLVKKSFSQLTKISLQKLPQVAVEIIILPQRSSHRRFRPYHNEHLEKPHKIDPRTNQIRPIMLKLSNSKFSKTHLQKLVISTAKIVEITSNEAPPTNFNTTSVFSWKFHAKWAFELLEPPPNEQFINSQSLAK